MTAATDSKKPSPNKQVSSAMLTEGNIASDFCYGELDSDFEGRSEKRGHVLDVEVLKIFFFFTENR